MAGKRKGGGKRKSGGRRVGHDGLGGGGQRLSGASRYLGDVMEIFRKLPGRPLNARQVASTMGIADTDIREMLHLSLIHI
mgnify:FL=1